MIAQGESHTVEFKIKPPRPAELAERLCGMANRRTGGTVLFGIADATRNIVGLRDPNGAVDLIMRAARTVKPAVPFVHDAPEVHRIDERTILVVQVPPNDGTLYQASGVCWVRRGSHTIPMTTDEIATHLHTTGATQWERSICANATLADLDTRRLDRYLALRSERSRQHLGHTEREHILIGVGCAARDPQTGAVRPTNVGMLMFGYDPQFLLPHSEVVCVQFGDTLGIGKYLNRKNITGTLTELVDGAATFVEQCMTVGAEIIGFQRVDVPEYPIEALREAIVNAVAHRDYTRHGETIRIFCYADRLEVHSPGLLPPGVTVADFAELRTVSRARNELIAQFLRDVPGYMERIGMGVRMMVQEMRQLGLPTPEFVEQHEFVVTFRNGRRVAPTAESPFNPRQLLGLRLLQERGSLTRQEYMDATGTSESTALRELRELVERGVIVMRGKTRSARYFLP